MSDLQEQRDRILLATLDHVVFEGWTDRAMRMGLSDAGMTETDGLIAFPGGVADMVGHFSDYADRQMLAAVEKENGEKRGVTARIAAAVRARLEICEPWREQVRRAVGFLALPRNAPLAARCNWRTVDAMWHAAGDASADFSFYTKRATLAAVYTATLLYWLEDESEDFAETWGFLDRRLADVGRFHRFRGQAQQRMAAFWAGVAPPDPARMRKGFRTRGGSSSSAG
ncbi:MAG: COQ9 family protein [Rhodospirillales bacterium]|nr:COQ9 family protein [Rhodospirillales bacterium]MCW8861265.1 COQ9 family protein [Rhodospirillales bacterium]MCW8951491.1 COQ9 family protein [Rhodospirillales bacterium]MCW9039967.1 COQ9 family protein [Rhodospirillales bacterium]